MIDTEDITMLSSHLIDVDFYKPSVSDFINVTPGNIF